MTRQQKWLAAGLAGAVTLWLVLRDPPKFAGKRFVPGSDKAKELFRFAAVSAGLPVEWGDSPALHYILKQESGGYVGRPNYCFNGRYGKWFNSPKRAGEWPKAWADVRARNSPTCPNGSTSGATGLGQLQPSNVKAFYPDGLKGVGDPVNEAIGMLKYIAKRYGSPEVARSVYGKGGKGDKAVFFTHAAPPGPLPYCKYNDARSLCKKGFKEGY